MRDEGTATDGGVGARADGELVDVGEGRVLRFVRRYPGPPADVWSALTEPDRMARWAFRGELEPRAGGELRFDYGDAGGATGTVLVYDAPRVLEYEWATDTDMPWRIRFELEADGDDATLLTLDHLLPDPRRPEFAAGWHWHLDRLAVHLAGQVPPAVDTDDHFDDLLRTYSARSSA